MGYQVEYLDVNKVKTEPQNYTWALLYQISDMKLCRTEELSEDDWKECTEARLFRKDAELHYLPEDGRVVVVTDTEDGDPDTLAQDQEYIIAGRFAGSGMKSVTVRQYLKADEDGQLCVSLTRLLELK